MDFMLLQKLSKSAESFILCRPPYAPVGVINSLEPLLASAFVSRSLSFSFHYAPIRVRNPFEVVQNVSTASENLHNGCFDIIMLFQDRAMSIDADFSLSEQGFEGCCIVDQVLYFLRGGRCSSVQFLYHNFTCSDHQPNVTQTLYQHGLVR